MFLILIIADQFLILILSSVPVTLATYVTITLTFTIQPYCVYIPLLQAGIYYDIHITPQASCSYVSFETNIEEVFMYMYM